MAYVRRGEDGRLILCADSHRDIDVLCRVVFAHLERGWEPYLTTQNEGPGDEVERRQALARP